MCSRYTFVSNAGADTGAYSWLLRMCDSGHGHVQLLQRFERRPVLCIVRHNIILRARFNLLRRFGSWPVCSRCAFMSNAGADTGACSWLL